MVTPRILAAAAAAAAIAPTPGLETEAAPPAAAGWSGPCAGLIPAASGRAADRSLVPEDLVSLRDIGAIDPDGQPEPAFSISPDGRQVAFQLRRADPVRNAYCLAMVVMTLDQGAVPKVIDWGGEPLLLTIDIRGKADFPTGILRTVTPRWSRDGRWIAYLKRAGGSTQVWRAAADGSGSRPMTRLPIDVTDFRLGEDDATLLISTRPALALHRASTAAEALGGFHYDDRFAPVTGDRPFAPLPAKPLIERLDVATGRLSPATPADAAAFKAAGAGDGTRPGDGLAFRPALSIDSTTLTGGARAGALRAVLRDGARFACTRQACEGARAPWFAGERVRFFRREGWDRASTAIYEWAPRAGSVRRLLVTEDVLAGCAPAGEGLVCLRESSLKPRRLERLDPKTGERRLLFDPNPEFSALRLGRVQRLHWKNSYGLEVVGDLVLPTGYRSGLRYPLVVVQYETRGFLRGGTGDEYPIQAFANRGYSVLSVRRPDAIGLLRGGATYAEGDRLNLVGFADRKSALSAVETGVRLAIARGVADPGRIGITGLSNGATTAISALLHSPLFSAAAMSSCCMDTTLAMRVGPAAARQFRATGYPGLTDGKQDWWKEISLRLNARRIKTPILLQLADNEYMSALEGYTALREVGAPIDMFIFPDEHHIKWQPAHRLAVYRRSLDWFDFWLRGVRSAAPDRLAELEHWDRLRSPSTAAR